MNENFNKIISVAKSVKLTEAEKASVRYALVEAIKKPHVRGIPSSRLMGERSLYDLQYLLLIFNRKPMAIGLIIALLFAGGTSFAAEGSLPGDTLYPLKLHVNEEVLSALSLSDKSKAEWEAARATRRLAEAETLSAKGELNADTKAEIEDNFERHTDKVNERIAQFEADSDFKASADVSSNFESSLRAHQAILARLSEEPEAAEHFRNIKGKVKDEILLTSEARIKAETRIATSSNQAEVTAAAEGKQGAAENKINEVKNFLSAKADRFSASAKTDAEAQLKVAENYLADGKAKISTDPGGAFLLFKRAIRAAQVAKLLLSANAEINVEVHPTLHTNNGGSRMITATTSEQENADNNDNHNDSTEVELEHGVETKQNGEGVGKNGSELHGSVEVELDL